MHHLTSEIKGYLVWSFGGMVAFLLAHVSYKFVIQGVATSVSAAQILSSFLLLGLTVVSAHVFNQVHQQRIELMKSRYELQSALEKIALKHEYDADHLRAELEHKNYEIKALFSDRDRIREDLELAWQVLQRTGLEHQSEEERQSLLRALEIHREHLSSLSNHESSASPIKKAAA